MEYIPSYRIKLKRLQSLGRQCPGSFPGLVVNEKSVPASDEDTATISVEAA